MKSSQNAALYFLLIIHMTVRNKLVAAFLLSQIFMQNLINYILVNVQLTLHQFFVTGGLWPPVNKVLQLCPDLKQLRAAYSVDKNSMSSYPSLNLLNHLRYTHEVQLHIPKKFQASEAFL
jgi:hypothetical protein